LRRASWGERSATFAIFMALGLGVGAWAAAIPGLKAGLGLDAGDLSFALLALALASVLSTIATGVLAPRFGTGRSTGFAVAATIVAFALPALAQTLPQLILSAAAIGLACGALDIAVNAHASDIERRWGAPIMSSFHAAFSIGGLLGASVGGLLAWAQWGIEGQLWAPLLIATGIAAVATPALGQGMRATTGQGISLAWPERKALALCGIALLCFLLEGAMADWSAVYLATVTHALPWAAAAGYACFSIAMAFGRTIGDGVVKRLGARRTVFFGAIVSTLGMAIALIVPETVAAAAGFALVGLGASNIVPVVFSGASRFGSSPSAGVAMVATCGYAGFLGGPPLIGAIATGFGLQVALGVVLLAPLLTAVAAFSVEDGAGR
jgi:MFS family permease